MDINLKSRPITNDKGQILGDLELAKQSLANINDMEEKTGKPSPVSPKFKQFLEEMVAECRTDADVVAYKKRHVQQTIDYDLAIANTTKQNAKLKEDL